VTDPLNPLLLNSVPVHDTAAWWRPWEGVVTSVFGATYIALSDGSVMGLAVRSQTANPSELVLAYAPTVAAFLGGDSTMVVDRALVTATGGSSGAFRVMGGGLCRDPDDPSKILLVWNRVGSGATWTYGSGFAAPSQGNVNQTYIYETADDGATWTEIANFYFSSGSSNGVSSPNGPVQKFGSLYLVTAASAQNKRHVWSSTNKTTWTHRYADANNAGVGRGIAHRGGRFYAWGNAGLASSGDGINWSLYDSTETGQGGPSFTYSFDGGATNRRGVIRRPSSGISQILRWASTTTDPDPVPGDFATDETYSPTGYSLPAGHQPDLCVLGDSHLVISTGPRIFGAPLAPLASTAVGGWSVGSIRIQ